MLDKGSGNGRQGIAFFPLSYSGVVRGKLHDLLIFNPETDCGKHRSCGVACSGTLTFELTNIHWVSPEPDLFQVPPDYEIVRTPPIKPPQLASSPKTK
jgi:hypothetical protein